MSKTSKRLLIASGIVLAAAVYFYLLYDQTHILKMQAAQINESKNYLAALQEKSKNMASIKKEQAELISQQAALNMAMPKKLDKQELMNFIMKLAAKSDFTPLDFKFAQIQDNGNYYSLAFTVVFAGTQEQVNDFVDIIRKASAYILALDCITINQETPDEVTAKMKIIAYSYKGVAI
ncbi:type 4a pilus biogenesis protein PilO [Dehalobacter sp. DCM]|uniref:type 4a pilus biogenesis protein PilO n=1 Tax=Dehalobacter sp. DCM TaxID=2907827 RepID=UPI003081BFD1|nr:type 4a pilus biogenesis protein PilO [Dehalobacter sp. DCM]